MFGALIKTRFKQVMTTFFGRMFLIGAGKSKRKKGPVAIFFIALLALYIIGALLVMVGMFFNSIAKVFIEGGLSWLYFGMAAAMSFMLCFVGSIFITNSIMFESTDNELLLSMPVKPGAILASRLFVLLILNYIYTFFVMVPAVAVYAWYKALTALQIAFFAIGVALLPLLTMCLTCVCGWAIGLLLSKIGHKSLVTSVFMIAFFAGYMYVYMNISKYITGLIENGSGIGETLRKAIPPIYWFGTAVGESSFLDMAFFILSCVIPFALLCAVLSVTFIKIVTAKKSVSAVKYVERELKVGSARSTLLRKELRRFFSLPIYIFNCGLGGVFSLFLAGFMLFRGQGIVNSLGIIPGIGAAVPDMVTMALCFCSVMTITSCVSISLEGERFWILKSSPVDASDIFAAKLGVNIIVGLPIVISAALCAAVVKPDPLQLLLMFALPIIILCFTALFGLTVNLFLPKLEWVNETAVIKMSASSFISVLGAMGFIALPVVLYMTVFHTVGLSRYMSLCAGVFSLACIGIAAFLFTAGKRIFNRI